MSVEAWLSLGGNEISLTSWSPSPCALGQHLPLARPSSEGLLLGEQTRDGQVPALPSEFSFSSPILPEEAIFLLSPFSKN